METNSTVSVYHCELYVAGTQIYLYDVFANVYVVGGVDQLSTFRSNWAAELVLRDSQNTGVSD